MGTCRRYTIVLTSSIYLTSRASEKLFSVFMNTHTIPPLHPKKINSFLTNPAMARANYRQFTTDCVLGT